MIIEILCLRVFSSYNNIATFNLQWYRARDLFGSQIPITTGAFELQISCKQSSYLNQQAIRRSSVLGNYFVFKRFPVQTILLSLEFVTKINLEHDTIAV